MVRIMDSGVCAGLLAFAGIGLAASADAGTGWLGAPPGAECASVEQGGEGGASLRDTGRAFLSALPAVDTQNRVAVLQFYQEYYLGSEGFPHGWDGNVPACDPGDLNADYRAATVQRVNWFRAMVGLPGNVSLDPVKNSGCQDAALMMSANGALSHNPPSTWNCYTSTGWTAAASSNLAAGFATAWDAVNGFMEDDGQPEVGHRRWVLYPRYVSGGVGATFGGAWDAYALWVLGSFGSRPAQPEWVAWPPPGYVPSPTVYSLWSFTLYGGNFSGATVSVRSGNREVSSNLFVLSSGYGDPGISWRVQGFPMDPPSSDLVYHVRVGNVVVGGVARDFEYDVIVIDPSGPVSDAIAQGSDAGRSTGSEAPVMLARPNPFLDRADVDLTLDRAGFVSLDVYDVAGTRVRRLWSGTLPAGSHRATWDGRTEAGAPAAAGTYFLRAVASGKTVTRRILRLR